MNDKIEKLTEVYRILKPGGLFVFVEADNSKTLIGAKVCIVCIVCIVWIVCIACIVCIVRVYGIPNTALNALSRYLLSGTMKFFATKITPFQRSIEVLHTDFDTSF